MKSFKLSFFKQTFPMKPYISIFDYFNKILLFKIILNNYKINLKYSQFSSLLNSFRIQFRIIELFLTALYGINEII